MKIFSNLNARIKAYREEHMGEDGFSLLELVVAVGVLLALSVGGFLAYAGITDNAKQSAVESAAASVFAAAAAYEADGDSSTSAVQAANEYNESTADIQVTATVTAGATASDPDVINVTAWNSDGEDESGAPNVAFADSDHTATRSSN